MKNIRRIVITALLLNLFSCAVRINDTYDDDDDNGRTTQHQEEPERITLATRSLFPFQDNDNWWMYSEAGGNSLRIAVTDTISDDNILYYRVSFQEHRVDTTDDWFQTTKGGILFGHSLTGSYHLFLPDKITARQDTFSSRYSNVTYRYYEEYTLNGHEFNDVVSLKYDSPVIHGFDEIVLADDIGIIALTDNDGRWSVGYTLDSCSIGDKVHLWE